MVRDSVSCLVAGVHWRVILQKFSIALQMRGKLVFATPLAFALGFVVFFMYSATDVSVPNTCPAPAPPPKIDPGSASALLSNARIAEGRQDFGGAQALYWQCVQRPSAPTLVDVRAQLECLADLDAETLGRISSNDNFSGARIANTALMAARGVSRQCTVMHEKLDSFVRSDASSLRTNDAIVSLGGAAGLESSMREAFLLLRLLLSLDSRYGDVQVQASDVASVRDDLVRCALMSARQARVLSHSLSLASAAVRRVSKCKPNLLVGFESVSLAESNGADDPVVAFQRGLLMSEIIGAPASAPFVGAKDDLRGWTADWSADSKGHATPTQIILSEHLIQKGVLAAKDDAEFAERARLFASRLAVHAMLLTEMKQNSAAEWRYADSASMAVRHGPADFASSSLGLLSHFYSLRGNTKKALEVAEKALNHGDDALSTYLRASLRLEVGLVVSDEQMHEVFEQLQAVEGRLPAKHLEIARVERLALLGKWRKISAARVSSCIAAGDVADVLICFLSKLAFKVM
eukprot:TRINITY_DN367_c0_g1_i1.p1 TRINITY_DN367_c0_g1~~TRINITY_DN367_c0_g1_i1.p1  ORF type:complete len:559 (-),score=85.39 TRINITY_DN367_c0_g1_i1:71-1630(-)